MLFWLHFLDISTQNTLNQIDLSLLWITEPRNMVLGSNFSICYLIKHNKACHSMVYILAIGGCSQMTSTAEGGRGVVLLLRKERGMV